MGRPQPSRLIVDGFSSTGKYCTLPTVVTGVTPHTRPDTCVLQLAAAVMGTGWGRGWPGAVGWPWYSSTLGMGALQEPDGTVSGGSPCNTQSHVSPSFTQGTL